MNKKKIAALLVAGIMTIGVVGGTLAWFTSQDSVTNVFNTGSTDQDGNGADAGINVEEKFIGPDNIEIKPDANGNAEYQKPVLPGDHFTKNVWVSSTATYDQFLRARIVKIWRMGNFEVKSYQEFTNDNGTKTIVYYGDNYSVQKNADGNIVMTPDITVPSDTKPLDYSKIVLGFTGGNFGDNPNTNTWYAPEGFNDKWNSSTTNIGQWYYYNQILQEKGYDETKNTNNSKATDKAANILEAVTFKAEDSTKDNYYKNLTFDVKIEAEGIQASNGAAKDGWHKGNVPSGIPAATIKGYVDNTTGSNSNNEAYQNSNK